MSARVWTIAELDIVHPLPDGWTWHKDNSVGWHAVGLQSSVCVDASGDVESWCRGHALAPSSDIALAVILVHRGLDSYAYLAAQFEARARDLAELSHAEPEIGPSADLKGSARQARISGNVLRRGRWTP